MPRPAAACRLCGASFAPYGRGPRVYCRRCAARADRDAARALRADCRVCGKGFAAARRSDRYCSVPCRAEAARRRNLEHQRKYMADPEKRAMTAARARAAEAARAAREGGGRRPDERQAPRANPSAEPSTCRLCGRGFEQYGRGWRAYCRRCTSKADRAVAARLRAKCKECGKAFTTSNRAVRYCSDGCRAEGLRRSGRRSKGRIKADPEKRALAAAQRRAWSAARRG